MRHEEPALMIETARRALDAARAALDAEIRDYPRPVAGCDVQYTALLAARRRARDALAALDDEPFIATPRALEG